MIDLDKIATEQQNSASRSIDTVSTEEMLRIINAADKTVAAVVEGWPAPLYRGRYIRPTRHARRCRMPADI